jgi:hypothetical protein
VPTINAKNVDGDPSGLLGVGGLVPIQVMTEVQKYPLSTLRNINGGPPGKWCQRSDSAHHQRYETSMVGPLGGDDGDPEVPTINTKKH